ncbi:MAG TPA: UvrD-helicase domain-containing protein [Actinomycetota bacterium]|nr:UvrD-helicase domain-containing protein [Actinomycetota bacterium]
MLDRNIARGLNPMQCEAVSLLRGPVQILAGAGSGKTTTITRRIANQVRTGTFLPSEILAVTFTDKASKEMVSRLRRLEVTEVRARTFHAEALAQYRNYATEPFEILGSKAAILASLVKALPAPYKFTSIRDIATEIEWAKNRRLSPATYEARLGDHEPPIPSDLIARVFTSYERRKSAMRRIDFEDLLEQTIRVFEADTYSLIQLRERYRAFTVDEYQDVNLLQQTLLNLWVGERDDICVVGDDYQSIFGFTGASASYLLEFPRRYPGASVVRLTTNYRSTPEILSVANRLVPRLGGTEKLLEPSMPPGPAPTIRRFATAADETDFILKTVRELNRTGLDFKDMAVLYRINGRSEDLELALSKAGIPYQVKDSAFLRRPAARSVLAGLRRRMALPAKESVLALTEDLGYQPDEDFSRDEATRQADLERFRSLAEGFSGDTASFIKDLEQRFASEESDKGVQILTYHRAKGLEFGAVFLPRCEEKEIPFALSKADEQISEERRLFYVGITRAQRHLFLSWAALREGERRRNQNASPLLAEIGWQPAPAPAGSSQKSANGQATAKAKQVVDEKDRELFEALRSWRLTKSRESAVPAYVIFHDSTLAAIAAARPANLNALTSISGIGKSKAELYGPDVLRVVDGETIDSN